MSYFSRKELPEWQQVLIEKYPLLYLEEDSRIVYPDDEPCNLRSGFEFGEGWAMLVDGFSKLASDVIEFLQKSGVQKDAYVHTFVFKEIQGTIRWQGCSNLVHPFGKLLFAEIRNMELTSSKICEICSVSGQLHQEDGWLRVRCDKHVHQGIEDGIKVDRSDYECIFPDLDLPFDVTPRSSKKLRKWDRTSTKYLNVLDIPDKRLLAPGVWEMIGSVHDGTDDAQVYPNIAAMLKNADCIKASYAGELQGFENFNVDKCRCIASFRNFFGLKLTGIAETPNFFNPYYFGGSTAEQPRIKMQLEVLDNGWVECSHQLEESFLERAMDRIIDPEVIKCEIYPEHDVRISEDGMHYSIEIPGVGWTKRIAFGNIKIPGVKFRRRQ